MCCIRNEYESINDDTQLALFFAKVLERRDLIDDLEKDESEENTMVADVQLEWALKLIRANLLEHTIWL